MTPHVRTVLPTDLVALVSYDGRVYRNEAMTRDRIGTQDSPHPVETAFEQWFSFATGRHTCVSVKGPTLRGLISARKRASKQAWEIDCLIDASGGDDGVLLSLLDQMTEAAGKSGALRIFVRLPSESAIACATPRGGFSPYLRESVYRANMAQHRADRAGKDLPPDLRRRSKADPYAMFELYNAAVPYEIRRVEGMTFSEWSACQESLGRTSQYVLERQSASTSGTVAGWLRAARDGDIGRFDVLGDDGSLDDLVDSALLKLESREWAYTLAPEYQHGLQRLLFDRGFEEGEAYTLFSRRTVRPVKARVKVPAVVRTTFG